MDNFSSAASVRFMFASGTKMLYHVIIVEYGLLTDLRNVSPR